MKKFFIALIILSIFCGAVFFAGWGQLRVKIENTGVVVSKLHGVIEEPIIPGQFFWSWEFLLPTNTQILQFNLNNFSTSKTVKGQLPSGELYTSIFTSQNNFEYKFDYTISLSIEPKAIISLMQDSIINNTEDLTAYFNGAADTIAQLATSYILEKCRENPDFQPESIRRDDLFRALKIYNEFPKIDLVVFAITESKIPDYKLYGQLQHQFIQNQDKYFIATENNDSEDFTESETGEQ